MKSLLKILLILTILTIANSCRKESLIPEIPNPEPVDHAKDFLKVERTERSSYFISGNFDGKAITFTTIPLSYSYDEFPCSALYVNESIGLDQFNLIRENKDNCLLIFHMKIL